MAQSSANREEGKELLGKMINTIYELDEFVPDEQKQLVEQLDEMHEQIENIFDAMATEAQDNQNSGVMSQYRLLERDLEETKDSLRVKENECQKLMREQVQQEAQIQVSDDELRQLKSDKKELSRRLDREKEKNEELRQVKACDESNKQGNFHEMQEQNFELQQKNMNLESLLAEEGEELQHALGELQALAHANDDVQRRLDAATQELGKQEDEFTLAHTELEAAERVRSEAEARLDEKEEELSALRAEWQKQVPALEQARRDLQAENRKLNKENKDLKETTVIGEKEAAIDSLKLQLDQAKATLSEVEAQRDQMRDDREILEQVITDLSSEALDNAVRHDPRETRKAEDMERELETLKHDLELAKARSDHLAAVSAERAHELEALQMEIGELTRGDRGKEALIGEQKAMREKVRELRGLLDAALTKNRDAEEAKLHLEHKAERLAQVL